MSSKKKRAAFNSQWRKDRKVLKAARVKGEVTPDLIELAAKYKIDYPKERIK